MKRKVLALFALSVVAAAAALAGLARADAVQEFSADLVLRPGVSHVGHPAVAPTGFYGALSAFYNTGTHGWAYTLDYKGLNGPVTRVALRSRSTGRTYVVACEPCHPRVFPHAGHEGLTVRHLAGVLKLDSDQVYLMQGDKLFVEVDTAVYPRGEIGAPVILYVPPVVKKGQPPVVQDFPRCC